MTIDLGAGADKLTLGNFTNTGTITNVETVIGGTVADTITLGAVLIASGSIDLGAGADSLTRWLANRTNSFFPSPMPKPSSAAPARTPVTLGTAITSGSIDLGVGGRQADPGINFANTATVANVETLTGGSGADTITLSTGLTTAMAVDLGAGLDKLTLANTTNTGSLTNIETIVGGTGADEPSALLARPTPSAARSIWARAKTMP